MRIDIATAKNLLNNYKKNHWATLNHSCPSLNQNQDSRSVWFSLEELNSFITDITDSGADGIRFYFGEYPADMSKMSVDDDDTDDTQVSDDFPKYAGLHTLVMVPTMWDEDRCVSCDFNYNAADPTDFTAAGDFAENHGTLNPPPWPSNDPNTVNVGQDFMIFCDQNP